VTITRLYGASALAGALAALAGEWLSSPSPAVSAAQAHSQPRLARALSEPRLPRAVSGTALRRPEAAPVDPACRVACLARCVAVAR
jgi:hypothetical protein